MSIIEFTEGSTDEFNELLSKSDKLVLVDFWGPGCQPCVKMLPELSALVEEMPDKFQLIKVNTTGCSELAMKEYKILGIPTLVAIKNGSEQERLVGYRPKEEVKSFIEKYL